MKRTLIAPLVLLLTVCLFFGCTPTAPSEVADISFTTGASYALAEEPFWSDGRYWYVFPAIMSYDCTVTYASGATENIVDALKAGRVTIEDLERFGIPYTREQSKADGSHVVVGGGDGKDTKTEHEYVSGEDGGGKLVVSGDGNYVISEIDPDKLTELFPEHSTDAPYKPKDDAASSVRP